MSRRVVDALLGAARAHVSRGNDASALALLSGAATISRRRHAGWFSNPVLESLVRRLGARAEAGSALLDSESRADATGKAHSTMLHVMTRCYSAGGHTRLVERWIESDSSLASSVALTTGDNDEAPSGLVACVERSGGALHRVRGSAVDRARQLRVLARSADMIVLSIHENDVVPLLALADIRRRVPVVVVNHAEHAFWVGASLADVVVSLRPASSELAVRRRGVPARRAVEVPLPVGARQRRRTRADARRALGIDPGHKVLLTVGWRYKYLPFAGRDIITELEPILDEPDVHLVAVGPRDSDELWAVAMSRFSGRVHPVGRQDDIQPFLDAADVFVDSYPIASLTAVLEAAMFGLPVAGLAPRGSTWPAILREDDLALVGEMFDDVREYRRRISTLLHDAALRDAVSGALQDRVNRVHGADAWKRSAQRVQEVATAARERDQRHSKPRFGVPGVEDALLATYIADCEDRLARQELRLVGTRYPGSATLCDPVEDGLRQIDALLLKPATPTADEYDEALRISRSLGPGRLTLKARLRSAFSGES